MNKYGLFTEYHKYNSMYHFVYDEDTVDFYLDGYDSDLNNEADRLNRRWGKLFGRKPFKFRNSVIDVSDW